MKMTTWLRTTGLMGLGLLASATFGRAADAPGPIDSLSDLQDSGKIAFKLADENNDGQISQKEAVDAGNLIVGGFFFRADTNGDGMLSKDEVRTARDTFLSQRPLLRIFLEKNQATNPAPGTPAATAEQALESILDANHDGNLQASEVRQIVQTTVSALFASADTNRDGYMSPSEVNAAIIGMANAAAQTAFNAADTDRNGQCDLQGDGRQQRRPALAPGGSSGPPGGDAAGPSAPRTRALQLGPEHHQHGWRRREDRPRPERPGGRRTGLPHPGTAPLTRTV